MIKTNKTQKIYCYVDETGQDTLGKLFMVVVVIVTNNRDTIENKLLKIEKESKKNKTKWHKTNHERRKAYIDKIKKVVELKGSFYYSIYENTALYTDLIALTTARAIIIKAGENYIASIIVDGLKHNLEKHFAVSLRKLKIKTAKVKGARDESSPLVRLADSLAGLSRDAFEKQIWANECLNKFVKEGFISNV